MPTFQPSQLIDFVQQIFEAAGASRKNAHLVADSLVQSNLAGHDSHGVIRISQYLGIVDKGELDPAAEPVVVQDSDTIALIDAQYGFGQVAAYFAINKAIDKAKDKGLAAVTVFNCNHIGRLGQWLQMAAEQSLIGLAFVNGSRPGGLVAPFGGAGRLLGTNPLAAAVPIPGRPPFLLDFATSAVAEGKVRVAFNKGESIPDGWILDSEGNPSTNPADLYDGGVLLPTAGHKGYGLALLVELLGGVLTGQGGPWRSDYTTVRNGVVFLVLSIEAFRPLVDFEADSARLFEQLKAVPPAAGFDEVLIPGEPEHQTTARRRAEGIYLDDTTWTQVTEAAQSLNVPVDDMIG